MEGTGLDGDRAPMLGNQHVELQCIQGMNTTVYHVDAHTAHTPPGNQQNDELGHICLLKKTMPPSYTTWEIEDNRPCGQLLRTGTYHCITKTL